MSEETSTIIFEHPLNEKMRSWLRIENSLIQLNSFQSINSLSSALSFFRAVSEFIEVLDRGEIRAELLKELEKRQKKLQQWLSFPNVDKEIVSHIINELSESASALSKAPRIGQHLKQDKISVKITKLVPIILPLLSKTYLQRNSDTFSLALDRCYC